MPLPDGSRHGAAPKLNIDNKRVRNGCGQRRFQVSDRSVETGNREAAVAVYKACQACRNGCLLVQDGD